MLSGCSSRKTSDTLAYDEYEKDYTEISEATDFVTTSDAYSISYEMVQSDDETYTYCIIVDKARIAMYDVTLMAVEEGVGAGEKMMPSIGIFDGPYAMIPSQVNRKDGFVKGIVINGSCSQSPVVLRVMVEWEDRHGGSSLREIYRIRLDENGAAALSLESEGA